MVMGYPFTTESPINRTFQRLMKREKEKLATAVLYAFGTAWYCVQAGVDLQRALAACVIPFIPFDLAKMAAALAVAVPVRQRLERANLL